MSIAQSPLATANQATAAPLAAKPNAMALHGSQGRLIVTLQRYALIGWLSFFITLAIFISLVVVSTFAPKPVIVLDENRRVIGTMEFLSETSRTPQEILAAARYAAQNCLSLNADTIEDDVSECMNMMDETLFNRWLDLLKGGYVSRIRNAGGRSTVKFDNNGVQILAQKDLTATVRLTGHIETRITVNANTETREQPFDLTLVLTTIPRSSVSTRGFRLDELTDN